MPGECLINYVTSLLCQWSFNSIKKIWNITKIRNKITTDIYMSKRRYYWNCVQNDKSNLSKLYQGIKYGVTLENRFDLAPTSHMSIEKVIICDPNEIV